MNKDELIKAEINRYKKMYKNIDKNKRSLVEKLYHEAAYMCATLTELKKIVNEEGAVLKAVNGNGFETTSEHPAQKSYNTTIKNYSVILKQLAELVPEEKTEGKLEELRNL